MKTLLFFLVGMLTSLLPDETPTSVQLTFQTRGSQKSITVDARQTEIVINGERQRVPTTPTQWANVEKAVKALNLNRLASLKAPSNRSHADAAFAAQVLVTTARTTYESATFDHPNPPRELVALVKALVDAAPKATREEFQ